MCVLHTRYCPHQLEAAFCSHTVSGGLCRFIGGINTRQRQTDRQTNHQLHSTYIRAVFQSHSKRPQPSTSFLLTSFSL
jgi:hypothetical protein